MAYVAVQLLAAVGLLSRYQNLNIGWILIILFLTEYDAFSHIRLDGLFVSPLNVISGENIDNDVLSQR